MVFFFIGFSLNAQITFNGCHPLLENQNYTFNLKTVDATGRNVFETDPVTGDQDCGGIGVCEMQVAWSVANNRWEILADDGNGTFANTYVLYYNTEASTPNPPSLILGSWVENIGVTNSLCIDGITTLSGDVQDTTLGIDDNIYDNDILVYPNPASTQLTILAGNIRINKVIISDMNGRVMLTQFDNIGTMDISKLTSGLYFLKMDLDERQLIRKIIIK